MAFSCRSSFSLYLFLFALCSVLLRCASSSSSAASSPVADVRFKVFLDWLSENGAELTLLDAVEIKKSLTKGYSFVSRSAIESNTVIARVPSRLVLSLETELLSGNRFKAVFEQLQETGVPNRIIFAVLLVLERRDPHSFWAPYFDILPRNEGSDNFFHLLMSWPRHHQRFLRGSSIERRGEKDLSGLLRDFHYFSPWLESLFPAYFGKNAQESHRDEREGGFSAPLSFSEWKWAWSVMWTRGTSTSFSIKKQDDDSSFEDERTLNSEEEEIETTALFPLIDLANHGGVLANAVVRPCDSDGDHEAGFCLRTDKAIPSGTEITVSYGALSNSHLLATHGFVLDVNPKVELQIEVLTSSRAARVWKERQRKALLQYMGFQSGQDVSLSLWREDGNARYDVDMLRVLCIALAPDSEIAMMKPPKSPNFPLSLFSAVTERAAINALMKELKSRMDVMEKTRQHVERTASLGAEEEQGDMMDERELEIYRARQSLSVLQSEFSLLRDCTDLLRTLRDGIEERYSERSNDEMMADERARSRQWIDKNDPNVIQGVVEVPVRCKMMEGAHPQHDEL